jgi:hypothetical protein
MTKQEKIKILADAFDSMPRRFPRKEGEGNLVFVQRIVQEQIVQFKERFLKNMIERQLYVNNKQEVDVSDL